MFDRVLRYIHVYTVHCKLNYSYYPHKAHKHNRRASGIFFLFLIHFLRIFRWFRHLTKISVTFQRFWGLRDTLLPNWMKYYSILLYIHLTHAHRGIPTLTCSVGHCFAWPLAYTSLHLMFNLESIIQVMLVFPACVKFRIVEYEWPVIYCVVTCCYTIMKPNLTIF